MAATFQSFSPDAIEDLKIVGYQPLDCAGAPVGAPLDVLPTIVLNKTDNNICNFTDITTPIVAAIDALAASNTAENALITTALGDILIQVTAVNANTDTIEASLATLIADQLAGNVTLVEIRDVLTNDILTQLQAINANTDTVEALITATNTKLDTLIAELDAELVYTPVTKFHIGTVDYYSREVIVYDSETQVEVSRTTEYSADGVAWTATAPVGVPVIGWYVAPAVAPTTYDTNLTQVNAGLTPIALAAATYHSVSVVILSGSATIDNNGVSFVAPAGYSNSWEADTLLVNPITITALGATDVFVVDTVN